MVKKCIILLLIFCSCNTKKITKSVHTETKDSSVFVKHDSTAVRIDTSTNETEYSLEFAPDTGVTYISAGDFVTTRHIIKATIKTKGRIFKIDSVAVHNVDSTRRFETTNQTQTATTKKHLQFYWYILLILFLLYYAYRTAKKYKLF